MGGAKWEFNMRRTATWWTVAAVALSGCGTMIGDGDLVEQSRPLTGFSRIDAKGPIDVVVQQGDSYEVTVRGDENLVDRITTTVNGDELVIDLNGWPILSSPKALSVSVTMPQLQALISSGSGNVEAQGLSGDSLDLENSGSGTVTASCTQAEVHADVSGSGGLRLSGTATSLNLSSSGSGEADASQLPADDVRVDSSGSGNVSVQANRTIALYLSGSGDIAWQGTASVTSMVLTGSGRIRH